MGITQKTEAVGMYSTEGEFVEFGHSVLLEGPVEVCQSVFYTFKDKTMTTKTIQLECPST